VPGWALSVSAVLAQLEREPAEFVVDPWITERITLVALERQRVVAAAHLRRYATDARVPDWANGAAEIAWLVAWPDSAAAGAALACAAVRTMEQWGAIRYFADGGLPTPATYGIPACWPHIRSIIEGAGFHQEGNDEVILVARVDSLPTAAATGVRGLSVRREVAESSTRFAARDEHGEVVGAVHVEVDLTDGGTRARFAGWAGVWELWVAEQWQRHGVGTWLLGHAADWLRLAGTRYLLDQAWPREEAYLSFLADHGFTELTRTAKGWVRDASPH
jgi:GNAT superfamily N-acetyltransferase